MGCVRKWHYIHERTGEPTTARFPLSVPWSPWRVRWRDALFPFRPITGASRVLWKHSSFPWLSGHLSNLKQIFWTQIKTLVPVCYITKDSAVDDGLEHEEHAKVRTTGLGIQDRSWFCGPGEQGGDHQTEVGGGQEAGKHPEAPRLVCFLPSRRFVVWGLLLPSRPPQRTRCSRTIRTRTSSPTEARLPFSLPRRT